MRTSLSFSRRRLALLAIALMGAGATTACFTEEATGPRASRMESEGGNAQTVAPLTRTANPLVVQVFDQNFAVLSGQTVKWAVVSGGGSVSNPITITDAQGLAETFYTAGPNTGIAEVSATLDGLGTITFTLSISAATGPS